MSQRRMLIWLEPVAGRLDAFNAKTGAVLMRYCRNEVVGIYAPGYKGKQIEDDLEVGEGVPVFDTLDEASAAKADHFVIGFALPGKSVPADWHETIAGAIQHGMHIVNGLHSFVSEDDRLVALAAEQGCRIHDLRKIERTYQIGSGRAIQTHARRLVTVGTDCNVGKMVTALQLKKELTRRGKLARFVATGQTGVMVSGKGVCVDAVVSDFVAGAVEASVLDADGSDTDWILVEGQGAALHPGFSGVTLGLLHGTMPDALVLCHQPGRTHFRRTEIPIPSLGECIDIYERLCKPLHPAKVIGISLNCYAMSNANELEAIEQVRHETGLPVVDSVRTGTGEIARALLDVQ